ncbi:putative lipoprotein [Clostridium argentinense CDC 2741]|uniref:Putative lipoprotein n=1 Tax=Clostridium argentinense CDC 2741 TaxID=1418104 RepID=A0A0C1QZ79_9CLOT|nr:hypothetical protein [Clostridium argentinense]ARC86006.1 hypothetical protein RSJ17_16650 [Clostridium argentinense]KIE46407.1 putative lipoprotein [Clostridium argentinense CDC 2741]NFF38940.1 hypothetical protein [Clostridium argentinense]NFP48732.1 hypothetical protein [Clostridium argentinense]NFP71000.1 hypothetical protein [Clostridium argentinense]
MKEWLKSAIRKNKTCQRRGTSFLLLVCIFSILFLISCTSKHSESDTIEGDIVEGYTTIIHDIYSPKDDVLNIIAIDLEQAANLNEEDKKILLERLSKDYPSEIKLKNKKQLKEEGYIKEEGFKDGVLIKIDKVSNEPSGRGFKYSIIRWHGPKGATGYNNSIILYENDKWNIHKGISWEA